MGGSPERDRCAPHAGGNGLRRPRAQAQGGPAADHRAGRPTSTTSVLHRARCGRRSCARPRRTPRSCRSTPPPRRRRSTASSRCSPARTSGHGGALPDGVGPAGGRGQHASSTGSLAKGEVSYVGDPVAARDRLATATRWSTRREQVARRLRPAAGRRRPRGGARGRLAARPRRARDQQGAASGRWAAATSRRASPPPTSIVERRVVNHRTAGAAIEPRGVLADYRAGLARRSRPRPRCRTSCGCSSLQLGISEEQVRAVAPEVGGGSAPSCRSTARRCARRGALAQARPAGQVGRVAHRGAC